MQNASKQGSGGVTAPVAPGPGVTVESSAEVELSNSIENTGKFSKIMCLQFQPTDTYIEETLESDSVQKWIQDEKEARRLCNLKDWKVPYFTNDWELWMVIGVMWVTASAKTSTAEITLNSGGGKGSVGASGLASLTGMFKSSNRTEEKIGVAIHAHDYLWALSYMRIWKPTGQRKWRKEVVTGTNSHFGKSYLLGADEEDEASGDKPEVQDEFGIAYLPGIDIKLVKWVD
ncbi:hypothetical protein QBC38DRAFT_485406 [Podospora fimiseda]|uniref:Uncharacterized protein n=1 Tax=Podospora fimiseda TaxID=252190 RepID=A0AAN7BJ87_9PEZI|nr:hypothetical protein QBC38DRAFT_485406 [Podospora fimiseda]